MTLLADHGHSYTPAKRIALEEHLTTKGWRLTESLRSPKDVAYIRFGLETYASFATNEPAALATDLVACKGVELASFTKDSAVVVLAPGDGRAVITKKNRSYKYEIVSGDPLKLKDILAKLPNVRAGYNDADALLAATVTHEYPAPLQRLWRAHFALAENPPDVIASLADAYYSGSKSFGDTVKVASTHGGLNYRNSVTFIMSTAGKLPAFMRSGDIPQHMTKLMGTTFPMRK